MSRRRRVCLTIALAALLLLYVCGRILEIVPTAIPRTAIVALDVLSALCFALVDGARHYRLRGILVFAAICVVVGNTFENLSLATGFPFGHYEFVELMGPKLLRVPVLLGLAYIGMAYVSWILGRLIIGTDVSRARGLRLFAVPLAASFIMVAWDLAQDPVWGTVLHAWRWRDGGPWFGVPATNYFGWYLTVFLIYLLFALYLQRSESSTQPVSRSAWTAPLLFYALCAAGNVAQFFARPASATVQDATGKLWSTAHILAASALVSIFVMGAFAVLAAVRLARDAAYQEMATG
jgi:putative membrane protein